MRTFHISLTHGLRPHTGLLLGLLLSAGVMLIACVNIDRVAPPVNEPLANLGVQHGLSATALMRGRELYLTRCTACHSAEPIVRYSGTDWSAIVARMARRARLDARQEADVLGYVTIARQSILP